MSWRGQLQGTGYYFSTWIFISNLLYRSFSLLFEYWGSCGPKRALKAPFGGVLRASQLGSEHQCADTVDSFASWPFSRSSPSSHSTARYDPGKALRDPYAQKERWHLPQCDRTLDVVNEEHCDRNSLVSVATDHGAAHGAQSVPDGPEPRQYSKSR